MSKADKAYRCRKCGREYKAVPGHEKSRWQHCKCGHIAVRQD